MCAGLAPYQFQLVEGRSRPVAGEIEADTAVVSAAECCPMEAIVLTDVATGQPVLDPSDV
jgi:ferredoxin